MTEGRPLMERIITVTGDAVANPRNFRVPIGMSYQELLDIAGGFKQEPEKIICGGPMMGFGMFQLDVPTTKTSTALLALTQDDVSAMEPSPCINCGRCVEACPGRIVPSLWQPMRSILMKRLSWNITVWNAVNAAAVVLYARQSVL